VTTVLSPRRAPWLERISPTQWIGVDVVVAALFATGVMVHLWYFPVVGSASHAVTTRGLLAPLYLAATVPIALRRRFPVTVMAVIAVAVALATTLGHSLAPAPLLAIPLYTLAVSYPRRTSLTALLGVELSIGVALLVAAAYDRATGDITFNVFLVLATWFVGDSIRTRRAYREGLARQNAEHQRLEIERARQQIIDERLSIARELHDILAHSLSVIAIQSGVGRHVMDQQPDEARRALVAVEETSRSALEELRHVIAVLRRADADDDDPSHYPSHDPAHSPTPTLADLDDLAARLRATGMTVDLVRRGNPRDLPQGLELTVYRIVQEALTNVVKHAGGAPTTVAIGYDLDAVTIDVVNLAPPPPSDVPRPAGAGHGLIGMRERASAFGGSLHAATDPRGGYGVHATLRIRSDA
jgi:signal transduction histidine kinase